MSAFLPEGMVSMPMALGRAMRLWAPDTFAGLRPEGREFFEGGRELEGFPLTAFTHRPGVQEAYSRLRALLANGALPSRVRVPHGAPVLIDPSAWQAGAADRLSEVLARRVRFAGPDSAGDVLISAGDLDAVLAGRSAPGREKRDRAPAVHSEAAPDRLHQGGKGGNRSNPDADLFWIEVCRHVAHGTVGGSVSGFAETMAQWAINNMRKPWDAETIRKKLGGMFRAVGWDEL